MRKRCDNCGHENKVFDVMIRLCDSCAFMDRSSYNEPCCLCKCVAPAGNYDQWCPPGCLGAWDEKEEL